MRKLLTLIFLSLFLSAAACAQTSTQFNSGFITSAQCVSVPSSGLAQGSYSVTGTWTGTLTAYGTVGQGSQSAIGTATSNGSYTASTAGYTLFQVCGNSVASGSAFVQVYASIINSGTGSASLTPTTLVNGAGGTAVNAMAYGVKADGQEVFDATVTNTSTTVTCPNNDCNFTAADTGKRCFATNLNVLGFTSQITATVILPIGNFTFVSAQNGTCSVAATASSGAAAAHFFWGHDDTTALQAAWAAALAGCMPLQLPGTNYLGTNIARMFLKAPTFYQPNSPNTPCNEGAGAEYFGPGVIGVSMMSSNIVITPDFNYAACTQGPHLACLGPLANSGTWEKFNVDGGGFSNPGGGSAIAAVMLDLSTTNGAVAREISTEGLGANPTGGIQHGIYFSQFQTVEDVYEDGFGQSGCYIASPMVLLRLSCQDNGGVNLDVEAGTTEGGGVWSFGGIYGSTAGNSFSVTIGGSSVFHSIGDDMEYGLGDSQNYGGFCVGCTPAGLSTGTLYMSDDTISIFPSTSGFANIWVRTNGTFFMRNTNISGTSTTQIGVEVDAGGKFYDQGGNTNAATVPYTINGSCIGPCSAFGTLITAAKAVLSSGWGTTAAWTGLAGYNNFSGTLTASGTGQAANPTITYTFPDPFFVAPQYCNAQQVGGTQALGTFAASALSATAVTFTYSGTPGAGNTIIVQVNCVNQ